MPSEHIKMLFVCTANICRSATAHAIANHLIAENNYPIEVDSAGIQALVGHPVEAEMAAVLDRKGISPAGITSTQLNRKLLTWADIVVVFEANHQSWILDEAPDQFKKVVPFGNLVAVFAEQEELTVAEALTAARRRPTKVESWVRDPFREGSAAAEQTTEIILDGLRQVLTNLR